MKYLSKINITVLAIFSILLLILTSFVLCNPSIAHYKTRITVDTVNLEIIPDQSINTLNEETTEVIDNNEEESNSTEIVEEEVDLQNIN